MRNDHSGCSVKTEHPLRFSCRERNIVLRVHVSSYASGAASWKNGKFSMFDNGKKFSTFRARKNQPERKTYALISIGCGEQWLTYAKRKSFQHLARKSSRSLMHTKKSARAKKCNRSDFFYLKSLFAFFMHNATCPESAFQHRERDRELDYVGKLDDEINHRNSERRMSAKNERKHDGDAPGVDAVE